MRLLVCGGRYYSDECRLRGMLDRIHAKHGITCIIEGRCPYGGADLIAQQWAESNGIENLGFPMAGKRGPERNSRMLKEGRPTHCLSAPGGRGTADMVTKAIDALGADHVHIMPA